MMTEYAVRCCCQPKKIFGYLQAPAGIRSGEHWRFVEYQPLGLPSDKVDITSSILMHDIQFKTICDQDIQEVAVYSDDRPIEFWRKLAGFREVRQ